MKTLKNPVSGQIKRVSDGEARELARYGWQYVPKAAWKAHKAEGLRLAAKGRRV